MNDPNRCRQPRFKTLPRPYKKSVLVGNWYEDRALEEDIVKDYIYKREHGQLHWQKSENIQKICLRPVTLSRSNDQYVRFGSTVMLLNHQKFSLLDSVKSLSLFIPDSAIFLKEITEAIFDTPPVSLSASNFIMRPCVISSFVIRGQDATLNGTPIRYGDVFYIYSYSEKLTMCSVKKNPIFKVPTISKHNWVAMTADCSYKCAWKAVPFDIRERMELDGELIKANTRLLLNHVESNEYLCVEDDYQVSTPFGTDDEVTCKTKRDVHRIEQPCNHWVIYMDAPGRYDYPIKLEAGDRSSSSVPRSGENAD